MNSHQFKQQIETDLAASFWLKKAIDTSSERDVLDALYDAESLMKYCKLRAAECGVVRKISNSAIAYLAAKRLNAILINLFWRKR